MISYFKKAIFAPTFLSIKKCNRQYNAMAAIKSSTSSQKMNKSIENKVEENEKSKGDEFNRFYGTGRRKTSIARVWVKSGCGEFIVNEKPLWDYFQSHYRQELLKPFVVSKTGGLYDVWCTVQGGGISGQAGAVRLGISRALEQSNPTLRGSLKKGK